MQTGHWLRKLRRESVIIVVEELFPEFHLALCREDQMRQFVVEFSYDDLQLKKNSNSIAHEACDILVMTFSQYSTYRSLIKCNCKAIELY